MSLDKAEFNSNRLICLENIFQTGLHSGCIMMTVHSSDPGLLWENKTKQNKTKQSKRIWKVCGLEKKVSWVNLKIQKRQMEKAAVLAGGIRLIQEKPNVLTGTIEKVP